MQNLQSLREILLRSIHFQNDALNMEGVIAENNQNPAQRGFKQPVSKKQILLINQISLQTPILGEGSKSFFKNASFSLVTWVKWLSDWLAQSAGAHPWDTSADQEMTAGALDHDSEELKVPESLRKLYLLIYIEVMKVLFKKQPYTQQILGPEQPCIGWSVQLPTSMQMSISFSPSKSHSVTGIWCDPPSVLNSGWEPGQNPFHRNLGLSPLSISPDDWACRFNNCWSLHFPSCWPRI